MKREYVKETIDAMETAYEYILDNVKTGTPGKIEAVTELKYQAHRLFYEFATHKEST